MAMGDRGEVRLEEENRDLCKFKESFSPQRGKRLIVRGKEFSVSRQNTIPSFNSLLICNRQWSSLAGKKSICPKKLPCSGKSFFCRCLLAGVLLRTGFWFLCSSLEVKVANEDGERSVGESSRRRVGFSLPFLLSGKIKRSLI